MAPSMLSWKWDLIDHHVQTLKCLKIIISYVSLLSVMIIDSFSSVVYFNYTFSLFSFSLFFFCSVNSFCDTNMIYLCLIAIYTLWYIYSLLNIIIIFFLNFEPNMKALMCSNNLFCSDLFLYIFISSVLLTLTIPKINYPYYYIAFSVFCACETFLQNLLRQSS